MNFLHRIWDWLCGRKSILGKPIGQTRAIRLHFEDELEKAEFAKETRIILTRPVKVAEPKYPEHIQLRAKERADAKRAARRAKRVQNVFQGGFLNVTANCTQHAEIITEIVQLADSEERSPESV